MGHSIASVTGANTGLGGVVARLLAREGYREVIVTGRGLARIQDTTAKVGAETKRKVFTPLQLGLDVTPSAQAALAARASRPCPGFAGQLTTQKRIGL